MLSFKRLALNGGIYTLNGAASNRAADCSYLSLEAIWRENPQSPGTKMSVGPMIGIGRKLC